MFTTRLRVFTSIRQRASYLRLHSSGVLRKSNLTQPHCFTPKSHCLYSTQTLSPGYIVRPYSQLSEVTESDDEDNDNSETGYQKVTENKYAYWVLRSSDKCKGQLRPLIIPKEQIPDEVIQTILAKNYDDCSPSEVLEDFRIVTYHAKLNSVKLSSDKHEKILNKLTAYVNDYSDEEICNIMEYMTLWYPMINATKIQAFLNLESALDKKTRLSMDDMSYGHILLLCDLWFQMRRARISDFVAKAIKRLGKRSKQLTPGEYLHYMFLLNASRVPAINMYELEFSLEPIIDQFSANELGIIAMAFFKTRTPIRNPALLDKIMDKSIADIENIGDICISAIMKAIRYSLDLNNTRKFITLFKAYESRIQGSSASCLVHAAHAAAAILVYEKDVLDRIVQRFQSYIPSARLKDLERMLYSLSMFNYPRDLPHYDLIVKQLRNPDRAEEIKKFPRTFATSLKYLVQTEIYPLDLIKKAMDHDYLKAVYKNNAYRIGREYLEINSSIQIDVPEYQGPFLPPKILSYLTKRYSSDIISAADSSIRVPSHQKFIAEVVYHTKAILGDSAYIVEQLLPHHQRADVVLCVDENNKYVSPKPFFPKLGCGAIKYAPNQPKGHKWLALVIGSRNQLYRGTSEPCGLLNAKLRHLKKIGYTPIMLPFNIWYDTKKMEDRKKFLESVLLQSHQQQSNTDDLQFNP